MQAFFKGFLECGSGVGVELGGSCAGCGAVAATSGVGGGVVLGKDAGAVRGGEKEDGGDGEEGDGGVGHCE